MDIGINLENTDVRLDDGQVFSHTIWITNPARSLIKVDNVFASVLDRNNQLQINRPWDIKEKLTHDKQNPNINFNSLSPEDFWNINSEEKKPISEITYRSNYDLSPSRLLFSTEIRITLKQTYTDTKNKLTLPFIVPFRFYKKFAHPIIEEEFIDLGVLTSRDVEHTYALKVQNRFLSPAVITKVSIEKKNAGMDVRFGTTFAYRIPLLKDAPGITLMTLYARGDEKASIGYASGQIHIHLDVNGEPKVVSVPFRAGFFHQMFSEVDPLAFDIKRPTDGGEIGKIESTLINRFVSDVVIDRINIWRPPIGDDRKQNRLEANMTTFVRHKRISPLEKFKGFEISFLFDRGFSTWNDIGVVHTLDTFVSLHMRYYIGTLVCTLPFLPKNAVSCHLLDQLDFSYIAVYHTKVKIVHIHNPTILSYIIKRIEYTHASENIEIVIENRSSLGMRPYFKKTKKSINTFILIPKNHFVTMRIKIRPTIVGSFRETISLYTNKGVYSFNLVYKSIAGEILFTPSTLRYDLFYPVESLERSVIAKNKFRIDVKVNYTWSYQPYIFTHLKSNVIKDNSKESFLGVILGLNDTSGATRKHRARFMQNSHRKLPTLSDLVSYEDQIKGWEAILSQAKTEMTGEVVVQTDILNDMRIDVKGYIRRTQFAPDDRLDFGSVEEKRPHVINVTLHNPTEREVRMRFFVADGKLLDSRAVVRRALRHLNKKYKKYSQELVCVSHESLEEDEIKYYAEALFDEIIVKSVSSPASESHKKKICFILKNNLDSTKYDRLFSARGNHVFNMTRTSRSDKVRNDPHAFVLYDVLRYSQNQPPREADRGYKRSLFDKLMSIYRRYNWLLVSKYNGPGGKRLAKHVDTVGGSKRLMMVRSVERGGFNSILGRQAVFVSKKYRNRAVTLKPLDTVTLPLLVCYGSEVGEVQTSLLIKNDFNRLSVVTVTGSIGKVSLVVNKVIYISDGSTTSLMQKREDQHKMVYSIHSNDVIQKIGKDSRKYVYKKFVKRLYEVKNNGNLPIKVDRVEVEGSDDCSFGGFYIANCGGFDLDIGQSHKIEVVLVQLNMYHTNSKKNVNFVMGDRVVIISFEVVYVDNIVLEIAAAEVEDTVGSVYKVFGLIFISTFIIILVIYAQSQQAPTFYLTDIEESRFGNRLFSDNIYDIRLLETSVKVYNIEKHKNRLMRNISLKDMMLENNGNTDMSSSRVYSDVDDGLKGEDNERTVPAEDSKKVQKVENDNKREKKVQNIENKVERKKEEKPERKKEEKVEQKKEEKKDQIVDHKADQVVEDLVQQKKKKDTKFEKDRENKDRVEQRGDSDKKTDKNESKKEEPIISPVHEEPISKHSKNLDHSNKKDNDMQNTDATNKITNDSNPSGRKSSKAQEINEQLDKDLSIIDNIPSKEEKVKLVEEHTEEPKVIPEKISQDPIKEDQKVRTPEKEQPAVEAEDRHTILDNKTKSDHNKSYSLRSHHKKEDSKAEEKDHSSTHQINTSNNKWSITNKERDNQNILTEDNIDINRVSHINKDRNTGNRYTRKVVPEISASIANNKYRKKEVIYYQRVYNENEDESSNNFSDKGLGEDSEYREVRSGHHKGPKRETEHSMDYRGRQEERQAWEREREGRPTGVFYVERNASHSRQNSVEAYENVNGISFNDNNISDIKDDNIADNNNNSHTSALSLLKDSNIYANNQNDMEVRSQSRDERENNSDGVSGEDDEESMERSHEKIRRLLQDTEEVKFEEDNDDMNNDDSKNNSNGNINRHIGYIGDHHRINQHHEHNDQRRQEQPYSNPLGFRQAGEYSYGRPVYNPRPQPQPVYQQQPAYRLHTNPYGSFVTRQDIDHQAYNTPFKTYMNNPFTLSKLSANNNPPVHEHLSYTKPPPGLSDQPYGNPEDNEEIPEEEMQYQDMGRRGVGGHLGYDKGYPMEQPGHMLNQEFENEGDEDFGYGNQFYDNRGDNHSRYGRNLQEESGYRNSGNNSGPVFNNNSSSTNRRSKNTGQKYNLF